MHRFEVYEEFRPSGLMKSGICTLFLGVKEEKPSFFVESQSTVSTGRPDILLASNQIVSNFYPMTGFTVTERLEAPSGCPSF